MTLVKASRGWLTHKPSVLYTQHVEITDKENNGCGILRFVDRASLYNLVNKLHPAYQTVIHTE